MKKSQIWSKLLLLMGLITCLSNCTSKTIAQTSQPDPSLTIMANKSVFSNENALDTWYALQRKSSKQLFMMAQTTDPFEQGWIELALISKKQRQSLSTLSQSLINWRAKYPKHPANSLIPDNQNLTRLYDEVPPQQIAVLLPMRGTYRQHSQMIREGFLNAYYDNITKPNKQRVKFYDTSQNKDLSILYQKVIAEGADVVVGPLTKQEVEQMRQAGPFHHPVLALNYASSLGTDLTNFYEYGLLPEDGTHQMISKARSMGLKQALIIAPRTSQGKRIAYGFDNKWRASGGTLVDKLLFTNQKTLSDDIARFLRAEPINVDSTVDEDGILKRRRQDFDVIFVLGDQQTTQFIIPMLRFHHTRSIPIFANAVINSSKKDIDLNNVIACDIPARLKTANLNDRAQTNSGLFAMGQDAYLLSQNFSRLNLLPHFALYGETGAMTLSTDHQIHRRLPCVPLQNEA